ncbi:MAG: PilW family protein [Hydrogenophaga sp.]|uniref:PilW family protein n=1 Tax=Hydrogenophaga sp. TaxID=1904254 RepID=UPI0027360389|nr:PilW family protein [Hydrogenophaga sp.]MDP3348572.1 PilW family protein [Hydrogenophaga sp.]
MKPTNFRQRGLSLVELMVAMTLGLLLVLVAVGILFSSSQGFNAVDHGAAARDKQRLATDLLTCVILQAGYEDWANPQSTLQSAARLENPAVDFEPDVYGWDNAIYAPPADQNLSTSDKIANGDRPGKCGSDNTTACRNGSDILVIRFQGMSAPSNAAIGDRSMLNCGGGAEPAPLNAQIEERSINVFHLSKDSSSGESSLSCAVYQDGWKQSTPLVEGVESFQVLYGTDAVEPGLATSPNVTDSVADRWLRADQLTVAGNAAATRANWRRVRAVRVGLVMRGPVGSAVEVAAKTVWPLGATWANGNDVGSVLMAPADGRLRTSHSFTVHLRNDLAMP